jgi:hypothetical protein
MRFVAKDEIRRGSATVAKRPSEMTKKTVGKKENGQQRGGSTRIIDLHDSNR